MIHFCVVTLGGADLVDVCTRSITCYGGEEHSLTLVPLPPDTHDPRAHGQAIDEWRAAWKGAIKDTDTVVVMDPDCAFLSHLWRTEMQQAFADPHVGIWGDGSAKDFGPRVHASFLCVRGALWNLSSATFQPIGCDPWRDTGGFYCEQAVVLGWRVQPTERGEDWPVRGASAHWYRQAPMWSHLGGGTHSDPTRLIWWQRLRRWRAIRQRHQWSQAICAHFACSLS